MTSTSPQTSTEVRRLLVRNTLYLTVSQVLTVPLSVLVNAVLGRYLGPESLGYMYFAMTLAGFGFLLVNWGHEGALPAIVSRDNSVVGTMLGSSLAWRILLSLLVSAVLEVGCRLFGYPTELRWAVALTCLQLAFVTMITAYKDAMRGLERTDIPALVHVGQQLLTAALVIPVLLLGGGLNSALSAQAVACIVVLPVIARALSRVGVGKLRVETSAIKQLFASGTPFVIFGLAMALQPSVDAAYLSKLAPPEVMGWYAATRRLLGVLVLPATALIGALYPTLCRLHSSDPDGFIRTANGALRTVVIVAVPVACGCALFPEIGISIFSRRAFLPAEDNLRVLSLFLFLAYVSMPLGTCVLAAGKQRAWSFAQSFCVVASLVLDPLLIPWFQARTGNGGLGPCVAAVFSEVVVVAWGLWLAPRGVIDAALGRAVLRSALAGGGMVLVAVLAKSISAFIVAPVACLAYLGVLWLVGGINRQFIANLRELRGR